MNINLTQDQLDLIVRAMTKYSRTLSVDVSNNFFGLSREETASELDSVRELLGVLHYETNANDSSIEIYEEDTRVPIKKTITEWDPNDPRNW